MKKSSLLPSPRHFKILVVLPPLLLVLFYVAFALLATLSLFQESLLASKIVVWFGGFYMIGSFILLPLYLMGVSAVFFVRKEQRLLSAVVFFFNLLWLLFLALMMSPTAQSV